MHIRNVALIAATLLLVCQFAPAQSAVSPAHVIANVNLTGKAAPLVSASQEVSGHYRQHVWIAETLKLGKLAQTTPFALPSFCNHASGSNYNFCPTGVLTAYNVYGVVGGNGGAGMTIAIVDAFHYAGAEADLATFNAAMGLPACTTGNGCFKQVNQTGGAPGGPADNGWAVEVSLDIEWAHAMAPNAKIVLVEGDDNSFDSLNIAVATAVNVMGADIVSNSYGAVDFPGESFYDAAINFNKPLLYSSGDASTPTSYPCSSPYATCIGGTKLTVDGTLHRTAEVAWGDGIPGDSGGGGGCSVEELDPGYQSSNGVLNCFPLRSTPDVSALADPSHGVVVAIFNNPGVPPGYYRVGGTSVAAPVTAGIYANVNTARVSFGKARFGQMNGVLYQAFKANAPYFYFDVVLGSNGLPAGPGYDLATGMGVSKSPAMANRFFGLP